MCEFVRDFDKSLIGGKIEDFPYGPDAAKQCMDIYFPEVYQRRWPVLFSFHGGGHWFGTENNPGPTIDQALRMLDYGFVVVSVRYRLGMDGFVWNDIFEDALQAITKVSMCSRQFNVHPSRMGIIGGSAGGHIALMLMAQELCPLKACIALYAPSDMETVVDSASAPWDEDWTAVFDDLPLDSVSPVNQLYTNDGRAFMLVHGEADQYVNFDTQHWPMLQHLRRCGCPVETFTVPYGDHPLANLQPEDQQELTERMGGFLVSYV